MTTEQPTIDTGGGAYVGENINTGGGDFTGRDRYDVHIHPDRPHAPPLQRPPRAERGLFGRTDELRQLLESLQPGHIVTLVGPGGIGKTALAAEAVNILITNNNQPPYLFPNGVLFYSFYGRPSIIQAAAEIVRSFNEDPNPDPLLAAAPASSSSTAPKKPTA